MSGFELVIVERDAELQVVKLKTKELTIGRNHTGGCTDISLRSRIVSKNHAQITCDGDTYYYENVSAANDTFYNGEKIGMKRVPLKSGDVLRIDSSNFSEPHQEGVLIFVSQDTGGEKQWNSYELANRERVVLGRSKQEADIVLEHPTISRRHAQVRRGEEGYYIEDCNSHNGTLLNGMTLIQPIKLKERDVITIASVTIIFTSGVLIYNRPQSNVQEGHNIEVKNISRTVSDGHGNKKRILSGVSFSMKAGELVAIVGGSGAGKTTLMNCMNGYEPATEGEVLLNGNNLYENYHSIKAQIGYVPQQEIIHEDLTIRRMLLYVAKLFLPNDTSKKEAQQRVDGALDIMGLSAHKNTLIRKLSGGQKKRVSIAVEMISDPATFFLDEPTSGLDPEAETMLMEQLKNLSSRKRKTIIVITHTLQNIYLFDKIVFLAPGGLLCFCGGYREALTFFGVENLIEAYALISKNKKYYINKFKQYSKDEK